MTRLATIDDIRKLRSSKKSRLAQWVKKMGDALDSDEGRLMIDNIRKITKHFEAETQETSSGPQRAEAA